MSRRLLGPIGGSVVFFLVAALVFGGLGWVTYSALKVEQAQREAAARAELGANLRVGLWRLDGRMLPALGVEDSRPYYHYVPADPTSPVGAAATPLLTATLPNWMKLHFQLDATTGWCSPQVPDPIVANRIRQAWPDLPLRNFYGQREQVLAELRANCSTVTTCQIFAARESATLDESLPLAAPLTTGEWNTLPQTEAALQHTPSPTPAPQSPGEPSAKPNELPGDSVVTTVQVLGYELCLEKSCFQAVQEPARNHQNKQVVANKGNDPDTVTANGQNPTQFWSPRSGRAQQEVANDRGRLDLRNRAETIGRGLKDAKGQYGGVNDPILQNTMSHPINLGNAMNLPSGAQGDRATFNPSVGSGGVQDANGREQQAVKLQENADKSKGLASVGGELAAFDALARLGQAQDMLRSVPWFGVWLSEYLAYRNATSESRRSDWPESVRSQRAAEFIGPVCPNPEPAQKQPATSLHPVPPQPLPKAVHLGSMRPQWITADDGTELLILVRTARIDDKTVYQGVVLDWPLLQAALQEELKDLFPEARLEPVKDPAAVLPDRAMTALPVQLDPGPPPPPPPAGWTPLRIGLVLAWLAAVIAFAAVGFAGWGLIDLAERRIRFVSAVTHELRTPLTSLRLYLDLLVSGMIQDEAKREEYLQTLTSESDRLHRLIDNVLDYARLEKRRKDGDIRPVQVSDLLAQLEQTWTDRVAQDGKQLVVISTLAPDRQVATDAGLVQQIVGNLIDNARKYTREAADPRIWVWAKPGRGQTVLLEVEDRGCGVPASERRSIFKPFRRGDHADSTSGGVGLGLALARSWAEVLGGRLTYHPAEGGTGSCFRLELPGT